MMPLALLERHREGAYHGKIGRARNASLNMKEEERFYLQEIGNHACRTSECIRASLSGRVNSYIMVVSFVVLAEATVMAAAVSKAFECSLSLGFGIAVFALFFVSFVSMCFAAFKIYKVFRANLSVALFPEDSELPFLRHGIVERSVGDFTDEEAFSLFGKPITEGGSEYADIDFLYRRWVFQQVHALNSQYELVDDLKRIFRESTRAVVVSLASFAAGVGVLLAQQLFFRFW